MDPMAGISSLKFQSAPLTEARGDSPACCVLARALPFQSAPLTEARGDTDGYKIRLSSTVFQSAPLTEARGDVIFFYYLRSF